MEPLVFFVLVAVLVLAVLRVLIMFGLEKRTGREPGHLGTRDLKLVGVLASLVAIGAGALGLYAAAQTLFSTTLDFDARVNGFDVLPKGGDIHWEQAEVTSATADTVHLTADDVGLRARGLVAAGVLLQAATVVAVASLVSKLCLASVAGEVFSSRLRRRGFITAVIVLVAGTAGGVVKTLGENTAAQESLGSWSSAVTSAEDPAIPVPSWFNELPLTPLVVAISIAVLAEVIARGAEVRRRRDRLEDDLSGLV